MKKSVFVVIAIVLVIGLAAAMVGCANSGVAGQETGSAQVNTTAAAEATDTEATQESTEDNSDVVEETIEETVAVIIEVTEPEDDMGVSVELEERPVEEIEEPDENQGNENDE